MDFQATAADGTTKTVTVPDNGMSRDELAPIAAKAFAAYLTSQAGISGTSSPAQSSGAPTPPTPAAPAGPDNSYANDVGSGIHSLETGVRSTADLIGNNLPDGTPGKAAITNFGRAAPVTGAPNNYQSATGRLSSDIGSGNYSQALSDLPHAAVQAVPAMAGAIGAGAVGGAVGGPVGAAAGTGAFIAGTSAGDNVAARAANNGRTLDTASGGDIAGGLATTAGQAALGTVGLRPGMLPGVGAALKAAGPIATGAADIGADALAGAGNSVIGQVGTTAGTDKGLTVDPSDVAAAGLSAGAARAGTVAGRAAQSGIGSALDAVRSIGADAPPDVPSAQRDVAVDAAIRARQAQDRATLGRVVSYGDAARTLQDAQTGNLAQVGRALASQMPADDAATFRADYATLLSEAASPSKSIGPSSPDGPSTAFDRIQNWNIPDDYKTAISDGMLSLDSLSQATGKKVGPGPWERGLGVLGKVAGVITGAVTAGPMGAMDGILGAPLAGKIGGAVGKGLDRVLGTAVDPGTANAQTATRYLASQGITDTAPHPLQTSNDLLAQVRDPQNSIAAMAPPDPGAPSFRPDPSSTAGGINLTDQQVAQSQGYREQAGSWMERQLIAQAKARVAQQQAIEAQAAAQQARGATLTEQAGSWMERQQIAQAKAKADAQAAAAAAQAKMEARGTALREQAANALQGQQYRSDPGVLAARAAGVSGVPALSNSMATGTASPEVLFTASKGMAGSPAQPSDPLMQTASGASLPATRDAGLTAAQAVSGRPSPTQAQTPPPSSPTAATTAPWSPALRRAQAVLQARGPAPASIEPATSSQSVLPTGFTSYVQRAVHSNGGDATGHDVHAAIDDLVQADKLDPQIGQRIKGGALVPVNSPEAQAVIAQTFHRVGLGNRLMDRSTLVDPNAALDAQPFQGAAPPPGARPPIYDMPRWLAARADYQHHVESVAAAASASDPQLASVVRAIGATKSAAQKQAAAEAFLNALPRSSARRQTAAAVLASPALLKGI